MIEIIACGERCLCDFTFDFYWQHQGSRLDMDGTVCGVSFRRMVEALRRGESVRIRGDVGSRLGSSLGVDLLRLGGKGGPIESTGRIIVDGDVGSHMGISMLRGAIYVSGSVKPPLGNAVGIESDLSGYQKFVSVTEVLERGLSVLEPNVSSERGLEICDGVLRDTLGARNPTEKRILLHGDGGMSSGILMHSGSLEIDGNCGPNTGVLMQGGRIVVRGRTGDFTGAEMRGGGIIVEGDAGSFACARMRGGTLFAMRAKPVPPAKEQMPDGREQAMISGELRIPTIHAMMYRKFGL
ncbi:MAG: tributyrin esterase [Methanothrix sp.]|jgi:formylmethanofuran dehydrogenase subunit C|nr:tributyrin esterase [Methanothrix sp.]